MIFRVLHSFIDSSRDLFLLIVPVTFAISLLAAWRNVRLWFREGTDYEQALKEQEGQSHKLHIPPVR